MTIRRRRGQRRSRLTRMRQRLNIAAQLQSTIDAAKIKEIKDKGRPEDWRSIQGLGLGGIGSRKQGFPCPSPVVFYKLINLSSIRPSSLPQITALLSLSACKMSVTDVLKRKSGVIVGDDVLNVCPPLSASSASPALLTNIAINSSSTTPRKRDSLSRPSYVLIWCQLLLFAFCFCSHLFFGSLERHFLLYRSCGPRSCS